MVTDSDVTTWSGRTQLEKNKDIIFAEDYGAVGDGSLHLLSEKYATLTAARTAYPHTHAAGRLTALTQSLDWAAIQEALYASRGGTVKLARKTYLITDTIDIPRQSTLEGVGGGDWNIVPSNTLTSPSQLYSLDVGSNLLFVGTGAKKYTVDYVSTNETAGFSRDNPISQNSLDTKIEMLDATNQNAVGATRATLKPMSACIKLGDGRNGYGNSAKIKNLRIVTNCPGSGETYGTGGYLISAPSYQWDDWDIGIIAWSPWRTVVEGVNVCGYYNVRGVLMVSMCENGSGGTYVAPNGSNTGCAEFISIRGSRIQGGLSLRSGDIVPILGGSSTENTLYVKWWPGHRFPASGDFACTHANPQNLNKLTYTSLSYDAVNNYLVFNGVTNAAALLSTLPNAIETTSTAGFSNTNLENSEFSDFAHASGNVEWCTLFGPKAMKPRAAVEIGGHPTRAIAFNGCLATCRGLAMYHMSNARDVEFYSCYAEAKTSLYNGTTLGSAVGACFVYGASNTYSSLIPTYHKGIISSDGAHLTGGINRSPLVTPIGKMAALQDCFNPRYYFDSSQQFGVYDENNTVLLQGHNGKSVGLMAFKGGNGDELNVILGDSTGNVKIGTGISASKLTLSSLVVNISNENPKLRFTHQDGTAGVQTWEINNVANAGTFAIRTMSDDGSAAGTNALAISRSGLSPTAITVTGNLQPSATDTYSLGTPFARWSTVFAATGTINTSDINYKDDVDVLTDTEIAVAKACAKLIRTFKLKNGSRSRTHVGTIAQSVADAFVSNGLDPKKYGLYCYDQWDAKDAVVESWQDEYDESGVLIRRAGSAVVEEAVEAGERYGIRYDEFNAFVIAGLSASYHDLEQRIAALESHM